MTCVLACEKITTETDGDNRTANNNLTALTINAVPNNIYVDSFNAVNHDGDTTETPTILGSQLTNPYLIPNMQQAYANLGITNVSVAATHQYVRFKPTIDQMSYLDSFMEVKGLELFDAPLDYQILLEGGYYQDPSIPAKQPTWQYAVVPKLFSFPSGIQYELLAQIHIPADTYTAVETEAERLASLGGGGAAATTDGGTQPDGIDCLPGYHYDIETQTCIPNSCPSGYHWDGTTCAPDNPCPVGYHWDGSNCIPNSTTPPAPAPDAAVPAGGITVDETQQLAALAASTTRNTFYGTTNRLAPVRQARVVARRWFKVERTYTDVNGHFQFTKRFKHKVRINIKFKNDDAVVRCLRGVRVWNTFSPLNKVIGVYNANKNNISYNFIQYGERHAKGNQYWVGSTVHNSLQEYKDFAATEHIGLPPTKLNILITNWASGGVTPMLHKRWANYFPQEAMIAFIANQLSAITGGLTALTFVVAHQIDVVIGYQIPTGISYFSVTSDAIKEKTYHELTHAAHYNSLGNSWYSQFVNAELSGIVGNVFNSTFSPYGNGSQSYSAIIALGESWAYYMGHVMDDMRYGNTSSDPQSEQPGRLAHNTITTIGGITTATSAHINVLEIFDPNLTADPFRWIPQGLYEDLLDTRNETIATGGTVNDAVSNYTNQQMFNAFTSGITTLQGYRTNLLNTTTNPTSGSVTNLFSDYHY